jgi:hypothetical protein
MRWRCLGSDTNQLGNEDEAVTNPKPYDVSKRRVLEAYRRVSRSARINRSGAIEGRPVCEYSLSNLRSICARASETIALIGRSGCLGGIRVSGET